MTKPLLWTTVAWVASMVLLSISLAGLIIVPDKWDRAVAIRVCGDLPIVQREDGTVWLLRRGWRAYRVKDDNPKELC